ncbi:hypothetical protein ONZ45_g6144 [Pleurotus djamor]|nr:hypothetical protein ONZ45_g6144 [Pleurotus djamor]
MPQLGFLILAFYAASLRSNAQRLPLGSGAGRGLTPGQLAAVIVTIIIVVLAGVGFFIWRVVRHQRRYQASQLPPPTPTARRRRLRWTFNKAQRKDESGKSGQSAYNN